MQTSRRTFLALIPATLAATVAASPNSPHAAPVRFDGGTLTGRILKTLALRKAQGVRVASVRVSPEAFQRIFDEHGVIPDGRMELTLRGVPVRVDPGPKGLAEYWVIQA